MSIEYKQIILNILKENSIKILPSDEVFSQDKELALALWNNFEIKKEGYQSLNVKEWYESAKWGEKLIAYKKDVDFWNKALSMKSNSIQIEIITSLIFQFDFPEIYQHFIETNDYLVNLFQETNNQKIYELITLPSEHKEELMKDYLSSKGLITKEIVDKYKNDEKFIKKILNRSSRFYEFLDEEDKQKNEYIKISFNSNSNSIWEWLPENKKEEFFPLFLNKYAKTIRAKDLDLFSEEQQEKIIHKNDSLLLNVFDRKLDNKTYNRYLKLAKEYVTKNIHKGISTYQKNVLEDMMDDQSFVSLIKPELISFINTYASIYPEDLTPSKYIKMISKNNELQNLLEQNIHYQLGKELMKLSEQITIENFENSIEKVIFYFDNNMITEKVAEEYTQTIKNKLRTLLKGLKLPQNDVFKYLRMKKLNEELQQNLNTNNIVKQKNKI